MIGEEKKQQGLRSQDIKKPIQSDEKEIKHSYFLKLNKLITF